MIPYWIRRPANVDQSRAGRRRPRVGEPRAVRGERKEADEGAPGERAARLLPRSLPERCGRRRLCLVTGPPAQATQYHSAHLTT